jgi:hypothetical protein
LKIVFSVVVDDDEYNSSATWLSPVKIKTPRRRIETERIIDATTTGGR